MSTSPLLEMTMARKAKHVKVDANPMAPARCSAKHAKCARHIDTMTVGMARAMGKYSRTAMMTMAMSTAHVQT